MNNSCSYNRRRFKKSITLNILRTLLTLYIALSYTYLTQGQVKTDSILAVNAKATQGICNQFKILNNRLYSIELNNRIDTIYISNYALDSIYIYSKINSTIKSTSNKKNWLLDLTSKIIAALVGFIGAYILFKLQLKSAKKKENEKTISDKLNKIKYLNALRESSVKIGQKQIEYTSAYIGDLRLDPIEPGLMQFSVKNDLERLVKILAEPNFFNAVISNSVDKNEGLKTFRKITTSADYIDAEINQLLEMQKAREHKNYERKSEYVEIINPLFLEIALYSESIHESNPHLSQSILKILDEFEKNYTGENDIHFYQNLFALPLLRAFDRFRAPEISNNPLYEKLFKLRQLYGFFYLHAANHAEDLIKILSLLEQAVSDLDLANLEITRQE